MTSHYLNQCWLDSLTHICGTRGRWVNYINNSRRWLHICAELTTDILSYKNHAFCLDMKYTHCTELLWNPSWGYKYFRVLPTNSGKRANIRPKHDNVLKCILVPGGHFKNTFELLNLRALKVSPVNKIHIFQCMGEIFCVKFQGVPLKFHTKYLSHTTKDMIFIQHWNFKSS